MSRPHDNVVSARQLGQTRNTKEAAPLNPDSELVVLVCDPNADRKRTISDLVKFEGGRAREIERPSDVNSVECTFQQCVALVGLGPACLPDGSSLEVVQALQRKGLKVISYEDHVFSWAIGARCRVLLSGASLLLDSAAQTFPDELRLTINRFWESERKEHFEEQQIKQRMKELGIIGASSQMTSVFRWVMRVSTLSDFPVLISGETGTGKELIANALYRLDGKRNKGPFIAANCSAISAGLAESELFGHRRGAFTGAEAERKGLFRSAEGGVLFLDEIGELSQSLQAKLLRVLQEDRVLGVGFDREVPVDVRVIAATNKNLEAMVAEGTFREDLYHRLNVLSINVPPLRERGEDLQPLVEHFMAKYAHLSHEAPRRVSAEFLEALRRVNLSGNARQLENIVRRALVNCSNGDSLSLSDLTQAEWGQLSQEVDNPSSGLPVRFKGGETPAPKVEIAEHHTDFLSILDQHGWNLSRSLEFCERALLECALQLTQGNQSQTARLIGITPRSVYNKLQKHKLNH